MRTLKAILFAFLVVSGVYGQSDRGTITGTIVDPAGAVIASAAIEARNTATGAVYPVLSSTTGNYTIAQLPVGAYDLTVTVSGFKKFIRTGLVVEVAGTLRIDAALEVGGATESVTVQAEAPLLKTESGEVSYNVATNTLDELPILTSATSTPQTWEDRAIDIVRSTGRIAGCLRRNFRRARLSRRSPV